MLTVGASSTLASFARASSPSRRPTRPIRSRFHVDAERGATRQQRRGRTRELRAACSARAVAHTDARQAEPIDAGRLPQVDAGGELSLFSDAQIGRRGYEPLDQAPCSIRMRAR